MGIKLVKSRRFLRENSTLSNNVDLPSKPYSFLDGNDMKSFSVPTIVKLQRRNEMGENYGEPRNNAGYTSVVFLRDERYLVFGSIYIDLDTYAMEQRLFNRDISDHDLSLLDLRLSKITSLVGRPVRDICLSPSCDFLSFLTYNGYSRLHVCSCNQTPRPEVGGQMFEEKDLLSHSTCCGFSPDGNWLVVGVCSDYFTRRSRSHLVVRKVNPRSGMCGKRNKIDLIGRHFREYSPTGLLINLDFSPDGTLLAVSGSENSIFLLSTKTWQLLFVLDQPTGPTGSTRTSVWAVFHPLYTHEQLMTCTGIGRLGKWEVQPHESNIVCCEDFSENLLPESGMIVECCPTFAPDGNMLAIGFSNGIVLIVDPNSFTTLWIICHKFRHVDPEMPMSASSVCFSKSCQYLAVGHAQEFVTVWSLPRSSFSLKHFCRTLIISVCPPNRIRELPIPDTLKQYLLYTPGRTNL